MKISNVGDGKVVLISGGGKIYADIAARFVGSERKLEDILSTPYSKNLVKNIISGGHEAITEFDYFIFGIEGYSRVTETQLVRKRLASYLIKSGRKEKDGKRNFDVVTPESINSFKSSINICSSDIDVIFDCGESKTNIINFLQINNIITENIKFSLKYDSNCILEIIENWYNDGVNKGVKEEDLRYLKPQATEFKAIIGMNAHALRDWFKIRCCLNAQYEIRDLANKMLKLCKDIAPDLFEDAGANCKVLGYCPENIYQNSKCLGRIYTKDKAISILKETKLYGK